MNAPPQFSRLRRRFLFGLLLAVFVAGFLFHSFVQAAKRQQRAVRAVEAAGGEILYDFHRRHGDHFNPNAESIYPGWALKGLGLHFLHTAVSATVVGDHVTDDTLEVLRELPNLVVVHIECAHVTDDTLEMLRELQNLEVVLIADAAVTNDGLAAVAALPNLRVLSLHTACLDDDCLDRIAASTALEELYLHEIPVTFVGLLRLGNAGRLQRLKLDGIFLTDDEIAILRRALPNCRID